MNSGIPTAAALEAWGTAPGAPTPILSHVLCRVPLPLSPAPFKPLFPGAGGQSLSDSGVPGCS